MQPEALTRPSSTGILPPDLKSVSQLFASDARYSVPKYQRSFAWGPDEVEEFWEDLVSAVQRGGDYFLGTIVLHKRHDGPQEIIDGQQRLTCVSMVFSAIRNVFLTAQDERGINLFTDFLGAKGYRRNAPVTPKMALNGTNNGTYVRFIINSKNLDEVDAALKDKALTDSNRAMLKAYRFFLDKITQETAKRGTNSDTFLVPLIDCLAKSVKLITIPVASEDDANLFFESLNARGKELAVSDLVKNRLYFEAAGQVDRAQELWNDMEADLGRRPIPEYLRHYWIAKQIDTPRGFNVREKQLYRMVSNSVKGQHQQAIALLDNLASSASDYARITDYDLWPDDPAYDASFEASLDALKLFRVSQCNPILLNAMQRFRSPKDVARIFRTVAHFSFRYFIIGNQSPGNLERESNAIAVGVRTARLKSAKDVAEAFHAINPNLTFQADFELVTMGRNRGKVARYTLAALSNYLARRSNKSGAEQVVNPNSKQVTLEHILPQALPTSWTNAFREGTDPSDYVYRLGNLTLLTAKVNRDAADGSFMEKRRQALDKSALAINTNISRHSRWTDAEIHERQRDMAKLALEVWAL